MNPSTPARSEIGRRSGATVTAFVIGLPLATAILGTIYFGPLHATEAFRYVSHPVECVEVVFFCVALGALASKFWQSGRERSACHSDVVPRWDGQPMSLDQASKLLAGLDRLPRRLRNTYLVRRVAAVLDFLCQRRSAMELDDQLRTLSDQDALALEASYSLTRFITWAIPILGFLGTVLGITMAISGVHDDDLQIGSITGGLANAFDATALALGLTMITMFVSSLVERREQAILEDVDRYVDRELAHRFERGGADVGPVLRLVERQTDALLGATEQLVQRQAEVWARTLAEVEKRSAEVLRQQQEQITAALAAALEKTLENHVQRLAAFEQLSIEHSARLFEQFGAVAVAVRDTGREQQTSLARVGEAVASQAAALDRLQQDAANLVNLQAVLHQNLAVLAGAGSFDQAVHSLSAAVHLLTARLAGATEGAAPLLNRAGKKAA
jgi:hypothetical protein